MAMTGRQLEQVSKALRDAFTPARLRLLLRYRLDKSLDDISLADNYEVLAGDLVVAAQREAWLMPLLAAASDPNPGNPALLAFAQSLGLVPHSTPDRTGNAVIDCNANGTRVTYRPNIEPGSSGSPIFDCGRQLVALHHNGDPGPLPLANEGIPTGAIARLLESRDLGDTVGAG